jgi:YHS domain-containing protein
MDADRSVSIEYKGTTLYFCSKDHKEIFAKRTDVYDRFLAEDTQST